MFGFGFLCIASLHQGDLRLSGPPSGQGTSGGAQTHNRRIPADIRADPLATVSPTPLAPVISRRNCAPRIVTFTDCQVLVWALGGSGREDVRDALKDHPQKAEGVRTVVQWLPSHGGIISNKVANAQEKEGRTQLQPRKPSILSDLKMALRRSTKDIWGAAQRSNDERFPKFYDTCKANDYLQSLDGSDTVQIFCARVKHILLLSDQVHHGWSMCCDLSVREKRRNSNARVVQMLGNGQYPPPEQASKPLNQILWWQGRIIMNTAVNVLQVFLSEPCRRWETWSSTYP
ncbi:hypothetical protein PoB_006338700 [Plakobranchus ocellatus]|uniref:Uncharacterized protein n=1 Tax=Plakobranchus ocellatus TaxID=259542 RepID=A0AAV4CY93_9GAST|nr:hypothetical protein PoB_006338700 [Plakobranchus ocellatus]